VPLNDTLTYQPPENLIGGTYTPNKCSSDDGNGYLYITALVADNNCPSQQCEAAACVKICPAGTSNCTPPGQQ